MTAMKKARHIKASLVN